jgi:integrase
MKRRKTRPGLIGTRIYEQDGWLRYFAPAPFVNEAGKLTQWHKLVPTGPGDELAARNVLDKLLRQSAEEKEGKLREGDFPAYFKAWRAFYMAERKEEAPRDPVKLVTWNLGTQSVDSQFNVIARAFAKTDVADIRPPHVNQFLEQWYGKRSAQTYRTYLDRFFTWCASKGACASNPASSDLVVIKKPKKRFVRITAEQFNAVREALAINKALKTPKLQKVRGGEMMQCYLDLTYLMGQRNSDVRILRKSDVDEAKGLIRVKPGKTERTSGLDVSLPITPEIQTVLAKLKTISRMDSTFLIHTADGQPYSASGLNNNFKRAMRRAGLSGFTVKDVRSMSLTDASKAGYTDEELKVAAVHSKIETTRGYIKERNTPLSVVKMRMPGK